jgi:general stress protein 26
MNDLDARQHLWRLIADMKFGMLTTLHDDGAAQRLRSRPITTQNKNLDEGMLWMFVARHGEITDALRQTATACMSYSSPDDDNYVCVSGSARVVDDNAKKRELWSAMAKAWFPDGVDDPNLALVGLSIEHAEYWDVKDGKLTQLAKMAGAALTGSTPKDMAEHQEVKLR